MLTRITKRWSFDAAHHLPDHDGKCSRPHGHTYTVELVVIGEPQDQEGNPKAGMVLDYGQLAAIWEERLEPLLDHRNLNETIGQAGCWPTTAENIAAWIFDFVHRDPDCFRMGGTLVCEVAVSETPGTEARVGAGVDAAAFEERLQRGALTHEDVATITKLPTPDHDHATAASSD